MTYQQSDVDYGAIGTLAMKSKAQERMAGLQAQSDTEAQGIKAIANAQSSELRAKAGIEKAKAGGEATVMSGIMGGLSSLAGGFAARGGQDPSDYKEKVDFGDGITMRANDNGRLLHTNFDFRMPNK